jgi:peptidoglycan/LPS O-acetylase OafA/YrhL
MISIPKQMQLNCFTNMKKFLQSFQRITTSNQFIPEIDGLGFLSILAVILYHINHFISNKNHHQYENNAFKSGLIDAFSRGHLGVELFFVISGFILSYPFASYYINQTKEISLKSYFIRRLSRLEPPFILAMIFLF